MRHRKDSGIYNLGSGKARTFLDLAKAVFKATDKPENIQFMDTPADIRDKYQYFTEAKMEKLKSIGYDKPFHTLEEGIDDYVTHYLIPGKYMWTRWRNYLEGSASSRYSIQIFFTIGSDKGLRR